MVLTMFLFYYLIEEMQTEHIPYRPLWREQNKWNKIKEIQFMFFFKAHG